MSDLPNIPLCQSEFLQDFTICFGVFLTARKPGWSWFSQVGLDIYEHEDGPLERLTIWVQKSYEFTRVNLTLWEDKTIWISIALLAADRHSSAYEIGFYPNFELLSFGEMLEALDSTVAVSTRLCYRESPLKILRQIWKHTGEVKRTGTLTKRQKTKTL